MRDRRHAPRPPSPPVLWNNASQHVVKDLFGTVSLRLAPHRQAVQRRFAPDETRGTCGTIGEARG